MLVPKKLLDESLWIRESNQMTGPNYVYIGFQAGTGNHSIDENELADGYPVADDSGSERSKRLSNESDVCPLSDFSDHDLSIVIETCAFVVPRQIDGDRLALSLLQQCRELDASTKPFRRRRESRCRKGFPGQSWLGEFTVAQRLI